MTCANRGKTRWVGVGGGRWCGVPAWGGVKTGRPSVMVTVHALWWMRSWWWSQSRTRLFRAVRPPLAQCLTWWALAQRAGRVQLGKAQCLSRAIRARRMPAGMVRVARPTSRGSLLAPRTMGMIWASQASLRMVPADRGWPVSVWAQGVPCSPGWACRVARVVVMISWVLIAPLVVGSALVARLTRSVKACPRRCSGVRGSGVGAPVCSSRWGRGAMIRTCGWASAG